MLDNVLDLGLSSDEAVTGADYNGDGRDEVTVLRLYPANQQRTNTYYAGDSNTGAMVVAVDWGGGGNIDHYVIGDYLGDSRADFAVMRINNNGTPAFNATWYILENGGSGQLVIRVFGFGKAVTATRDLAVCGDYNGDGKQDIAVYRTIENKYYWLNSPDFNSASSKQWGPAGSYPLASIHTMWRED